MKHKRFAFLTSVVMIASTLTILPVQAADSSAYESVIGTLPDWTPMSFVEAMEFYNEYGKSHVEDNFICLVKPIPLNQKDIYRTSISGSMTMVNTPACTSPALFELEIPEKPDPNDAEALESYAAYCESLGIPSDDYSFFEKYKESEVQYAFEVQMFHVLEGHDLTVDWLIDYGDGYKKIIDETFTFENPSGFIEQTDIYSWLPDCPAEYNWLKSYSHHSTLASCAACVYYNPHTHKPYIAYCADVNGSTGASLQMEQKGDGAIEKMMESNCNEFDLRALVEPVSGRTSSSVIVYQPTADGLVDVEWSVGRSWSDEAPFDITLGSYHIKNHCTEIIDISSGSTIMTFIDADTGELIDVPENSSFLKNTIQSSSDEPCLSELFPISSNPCILDSNRAYDPNCSYSFDIRTEDGFYDFHGFEVTSETENRVEVTCKMSCKTNPEPVLPDGATRITLYDKDTGKLIPNETVQHHHFHFGTNIGIKNPNVPGGWSYTGPFYSVDSNPMLLETDQLAHFYKYADLFEFTTEDKPEVIYYSNDSMDLIFRIKIEVSGNINGDSEFSISDAVLLQKWLFGVPEVEIYNWADGDLNLNNQLDAGDLSLMKRKLIEKNTPSYVEPDHRLTNSSPLFVMVDNLKLYSGPDESYPVINSIPGGTRIYEIGYQDNNDNWSFTEYDGQYGWIPIVIDDKMTVFYEAYASKPVIYLYPEQEMDVRVDLELTESELSTTYPKYNNGWDVIAYPDGTLLNKADGTHHKYLFWDSKNCRTRFDFSEGFCVAGSDTERFLKEKLTYMGLTENEMNEFIVYWLPIMEHNAYNLITFQGDAYTNSAKLNITPTPDSLLRIFMAYVPLENAVDITPQKLESFERKGFTVVEWGGTEIKHNPNS